MSLAPCFGRAGRGLSFIFGVIFRLKSAHKMFLSIKKIYVVCPGNSTSAECHKVFVKIAKALHPRQHKYIVLKIQRVSPIFDDEYYHFGRVPAFWSF